MNTARLVVGMWILMACLCVPALSAPPMQRLTFRVCPAVGVPFMNTARLVVGMWTLTACVLRAHSQGSSGELPSGVACCRCSPPSGASDHCRHSRSVHPAQGRSSSSRTRSHRLDPSGRPWAACSCTVGAGTRSRTYPLSSLQIIWVEFPVCRVVYMHIPTLACTYAQDQ